MNHDTIVASGQLAVHARSERAQSAARMVERLIRRCGGAVELHPVAPSASPRGLSASGSKPVGSGGAELEFVVDAQHLAAGSHARLLDLELTYEGYRHHPAMVGSADVRGLDLGLVSGVEIDGSVLRLIALLRDADSAALAVGSLSARSVTEVLRHPRRFDVLASAAPPHDFARELLVDAVGGASNVWSAHLAEGRASIRGCFGRSDAAEAESPVGSLRAGMAALRLLGHRDLAAKLDWALHRALFRACSSLDLGQPPRAATIESLERALDDEIGQPSSAPAQQQARGEECAA